ncbi:MAG: hypothetical protein R6V05_02180 [Candidatus Brocadiia bacterium]
MAVNDAAVQSEASTPAFVHVPVVGHVMADVLCPGRTWGQAHFELARHGLRMLTIREFVQAVRYLRRRRPPYSSVQRLLDLIFGEGHQIGIFLDGRFRREVEDTYILFEHRPSGQSVTPGRKELLQNCLKRNCHGADLFGAVNAQGLPMDVCAEGFDYCFPEAREGEDTVAAYVVTKPGVTHFRGLYCGLRLRCAHDRFGTLARRDEAAQMPEPDTVAAE